MTKNETLLLESISDRLQGVHDALYGNGDPAHSMMARQVRMEEQLTAAACAARSAADKASAVAGDVHKIASSVDAHHKSVHLAELLKSAKFWGYGLLVFVFANVLIDVGHPWVVALIKAWTGVVIP